jgi:hypothetical protein
MGYQVLPEEAVKKLGVGNDSVLGQMENLFGG